MKLLFRQRFFSWFDSYDIYDEAGNTLFVVKGRPAWGHRLEIYDRFDQHIGTIKEEVLALANKMPYMHFIAWDILITEDGGICVIEANTSSGVNIIQLWGGQRHGELGEFYRYHKVIKK